MKIQIVKMDDPSFWLGDIRFRSVRNIRLKEAVYNISTIYN